MPSFLYFFLVIFKGIIVELVKIKKLRKGHIEGDGNFVESFHSWIFSQSPDYIVQSRLFDTAHC